MDHRNGSVRIDYTGRIPAALAEHLETVGGLNVVSTQPLIIESPAPDQLLRGISPYLNSSEMRVTKVQLTGRPGAGDQTVVA